MAIDVELFDDLDAVARDAGGALNRETTPSLFDRLDWYRTTMAHCPPPGTPLVARARDGARLAWLFLMVDRGNARALANWYTLDFAAVVRTDTDDAGHDLLTAIAARLRRARPSISTLALAPILDPAPLLSALRAAGWRADAQPATTNWRVQTAGLDFAGYWARRPGQLRTTAKRKGASARLDIRIYTMFDEDAWAAYEHVYARSWKPAEGSPAFLRALAEQESAAGTLRLGVATKDGEPIAAQFWLVENGVATIHKLAHLESARALSPGTLLSAAMFREVIEQDRPDVIDFGTGDDAYKADWMDQRRTLYRIEAFDTARLGGLARVARNRLRSLVRRLRND
ncbi:MAG: hypothetical protein JWM75_1209 [Sphingomonas bacterium]|nr:hypothetical protein [Sphingomonas bacterium]